MILEIRDYFDALRQRVTPGIKYFVCGCDEMTLREVVAKYDDIYMFVDFGTFATSVDRENRLVDTFEVGVTVAVPIGSASKTNGEILDIQQKCFDAIAVIRAAMIRDRREHPLIKRLSATHSIFPFVAPDIARSMGFTFTFQLSGFDLLCAK